MYRQRRSYGTDNDGDRLPHGMVRVGYDADSQIYRYRDVDGSTWHGPAGHRYGVLTKAGANRRSRAATMFERPRSPSVLPKNPDATFSDFLPKYSRDCEPGHRTLRSRLFTSPRADVPPPVPPKDVPGSSKDIPELAYLRLGSEAPVPPPKTSNDRPELSRRRPKASNAILPIREDSKTTSDDRFEDDTITQDPPIETPTRHLSRRQSTWRAEASSLVTSLKRRTTNMSQRIPQSTSAREFVRKASRRMTM